MTHSPIKLLHFSDTHVREKDELHPVVKEALDACPSPGLAPFTPAQMAFLERVLASALSSEPSVS